MVSPAAFPRPESGRQRKEEWKSSVSRQAAEINSNESSNSTRKGMGHVMGKVRVKTSSSLDNKLSCWDLWFPYEVEDGTGTPVIQRRGKGSYRASSQFSDEFH